MNEPFKLTLEIFGAIALKYPLTLDGLLSAAVQRMNGKTGADTIPDIPLEREDGIFHGSALYHTRRYRHSTVCRKLGLRGEEEMSPKNFKPFSGKGSGKYYGSLDLRRGPHQIRLDSYAAIETPEVWFWGRGDAERCAEMIRCYILGLGKRANGGAGQILSVRVDACEDNSWVLASGFPARPIPVDLWEKIGGRQDAPVDYCRVDIPYPTGNPVRAVFPPRTVFSV